ncbi:hypothetical protein Tco_0370876 [Tanacetum coccineum]
MKEREEDSHFININKLGSKRRIRIGDQEAQILAYSQAVKKLEAQLVTFQKQQLSLNEKLTFQANEIYEKDEKLKRYRRIGMKAVKEKEQLQKTVDSWKDSSKNLWRLIDSGMSSNSKIGLGFEIQSNNEVLSYEEEMNFSVFKCSKEDSIGKPSYSRFTKTNDFKGVPHPLSGDYTPKPQEEIDDSLKMAREAEVKRVVNTGNRMEKPVWTKANRVSRLNKFVPRSIQLNVDTPNINSVRPNINTGRTNINSVRPRVNAVSLKVNTVRSRQPEHPLKNMVDRGSKATISGASEVTNSAGTLQTPSFNASEEKDEEVELIVVPLTMRNTEEKAESRKSSTNSKKEEILTITSQDKEGHLLLTLQKIILRFKLLEERIFDEASYDEDGVITDFNSLPTEIEVSPTPTLRIHNIHPKSQILGDPKSAVQTRSKVQTKSGAHAFLSHIQKQQRNNHKDQQHCLFACFLSQEEPKKIAEALQDDSWVQAMQEELLQFKLQQVWVLVDLPHEMKDYIKPPKFGNSYLLHISKRSMDTRGLTIQTEQGRNLHISGQVCSLVAEILKKFDLVNVKAAITPMETKVPLTKDEESFDVDVHLYRSMIGSLMYLTASRPDIMYAVCVCSRFQVTPKTSHLNAVKRIFKYLKGKPNLGLWYPRESPFDLEAFSDSDYGGSNLDRKSTTGGCQFLGQRLISWQCKKQTIVATSTTEAEYVAAANCCGQVLWVQNQLLDYGFNFMNTKIHIDNESTICIVKNPVYHSKTKHIEIRHHFIRDCYEKKLISVEKIHTDLNVADLLTKPFDGPRFNYLVVSIGMINP